MLQRKRFVREYELADLLLVLSDKAAHTFRVRGFPEEKLFYLPRGVDVERFKPGTPPETFRVVFAGALIKRKGIQHVLEAWHRLNLSNAELWLVGFVHDEAKPFLKEFWRDNIRVVGFVRDPENYLNQGTIHVFPSQWEGSAKVTYEAAACGLPQITTREAGDVVRNGIEGIIVKPGDVERHCCGAGAFVSASGSREGNEHCRQTSRRREFYLGPFSNAIAGRIRNRDAHGAMISSRRGDLQIARGGLETAAPC